MEKLKTDYTNGEPWLADYFNTTNERVNELIDEIGSGGGGNITTDSVISTHETDPTTGKQKTLQQILEELKAASASITVEESLDKSSSNPVQNKTLANILIFT